MSLMRHSIQHRAHKERAQPKEREKWGVLEKHKDYSLRARDYNEKKKRLHALRAKAAERNPDEFHFGMMSSRTHRSGERVADRGRGLGDRGEGVTNRADKALSHNAVKRLKTQDANYLRSILQQNRAAQTMLRRELTLMESLDPELRQGSPKNRHTILVETKEEQRAWKPRSARGVGSEHELGIDEGKLRQLKTKRKKEHQRKRALVEAHKMEEQETLAELDKLELQRARMNNTIGGKTKKGMRFKVRERKR